MQYGDLISFPNVSYVKAIDICMLVCLFNIYGTLVVIGIGTKSFYEIIKYFQTLSKGWTCTVTMSSDDSLSYKIFMIHNFI